MVKKRGAASSLGTRGSAQNTQVGPLGVAHIYKSSSTLFGTPSLPTLGNLVSKRMFLPLGGCLVPEDGEDVYV